MKRRILCVRNALVFGVMIKILFFVLFAARNTDYNGKGETMRKQKAAVVVEREFSSLCAKDLLSCLKSNVLSRDDRKWLFSEFKKKHASEIKHSFLLDLARVAAVIAVTGAVLNEINNAEIKNKEQNQTGGENENC